MTYQTLRGVCLSLLVGGCATPRATEPPSRCHHLRLVFEPRLTTALGINGSFTPSIALVTRPVCAPSPPAEER